MTSKKTPKEILGFSQTAEISAEHRDLRKDLMVAFSNQNCSSPALSTLLQNVRTQVLSAADQIQISPPPPPPPPQPQPLTQPQPQPEPQPQPQPQPQQQPPQPPQPEPQPPPQQQPQPQPEPQPQPSSFNIKEMAVFSMLIVFLGGFYLYSQHNQTVDPVDSIVNEAPPKSETGPSKQSQAYFQRLKASSLWKEGKYSKAIDEYTKAFEIDPENADSYFERGKAYFELASGVVTSPDYKDHFGNFKNAIEDFTKAISFNPRYVAAYVHRARSNQYLKNYPLALEDYTAAITISAKSIEAYQGRADAYKELKQYEHAISDYSQVIERNDSEILIKDVKKSTAYADRAYCRFKLKQYKAAVEDATQAIKLDPSASDAYLYRGVAYQRLGLSQRALNDFRTATQMGNAVACFKLGTVQFELADYTAAAQSCSSAIERMGPQEMRPYAVLLTAICYKKCGADAQGILQAEDSRLNKKWPSPIFKFMLDPNEEYAVWQASKQERNETFELEGRAWVGLYHWASNDDASAAPLLQQVLKEGDSSMDEWWYVRSVLSRISPTQ